MQCCGNVDTTHLLRQGRLWFQKAQDDHCGPKCLKLTATKMLAAVPSLLLTILFFVGDSRAAPTNKSLWTINIFRGPAPSPEDGPPASAHALRDPSKLKFEVIGIAGAYLLWTVLTVVAILIVRRRLKLHRKSRQLTIPNMDFIKHTGQVTLREVPAGPKSPLSPLSPKSPGKMASIKSWARGNKRRQSAVSVDTANTRIDERVVDHDKARNMDEMTKLYAAVMLHDEERASNRGDNSAGSSPITDGNTPVTPKSPQYPAELAHPAYHHPQPYPSHYNHQQQVHPQQYQQPEIYPQQHRQLQHDQMQPVPAMDNDQQALLEGPAPPRKTKATALSIISSTASRLGSSHSAKARPSPITVRGQPISQPLGSADLRQSAFSPSQASFQSTVYSPGPPPPTPGKMATQVVEEIEMHGRAQPTSQPSESTNGSSNALPFRQYYNEALRSAPATKTTFVDRRASAMNGPKTGVPKTPYSPYCPTTPMTPVTPRRLLNKEELKKSKKQYALQAVSENEMVQNDDDMWGR